MQRAVSFVIVLPLVMTAPAAADEQLCGPGLHMRYVEAAPRDHAIIEHRSPEGWRIAHLIWRLDRSEGALIFDTVSGGAGVDSAHPFIALESPVQLADLPLVGDGDTTLALDFAEFASGAVFEFSIDLDDTALGLPDTIVDGREIVGAEVEAMFVNEAGVSLTLTGSFGEDATVEIRSPCTS